VVDPTTHSFQTGDRFLLLYRPSMPGRVDVFNINPMGVQTTIDTAQVAGGQLMTLGPYEFTDTSGSESLRLVLTPCSDPALLAATRDIVKVGGSAGLSGAAAVPSSPSQCGGPGAQAPAQTRDIRKVQSDQGTAYALDAVAPGEISTGHYASRQITITFNHR
jgi:hypothetical protein